ncbi:hypothetical protein Lal_00007554 [Lupinus albus]|uniref:Replication protein A subunit n=1 Tax=Lupinus albus TaxID=3870 RepID=A0A6A4NWV0_LUPAL|nr:putative transcription factor interactor and regulator CCHC(Zn) family [Lupinus albus]KAF1874938.1 hypothetical protein Lal_00007554 [Lupinus albus]
MAVNLTSGAITAMCSDDSSTSSEDLKPVLQVIDLKQVQSQQNAATERFRLVLSDGSLYQQGMLATQKNDLVRSGRLQKGSVVKLTQFICNVVQERKIIIIIELDVVLEKCDLIGEPVAAPRSIPARPSTGQPGVTAKPNVVGPPVDHPKVSYPTSTAEPVRYGASNAPTTYSKVEPGITLPRSTSYNGSSGDQNMSFRGPQSEASRHMQNSYARPPQPMYRQPPPVYHNRGPMARNEAPPRIIPISGLNPYQNTWTIKARVTAKGELRHYNNARGDGKVFSFDLLDSDGGEIRATCFNAVADQFYSVIEAGKVYLISRGTVKPAQKNFNHLNNDQELTLDITSIIQPCPEDDSSIPKQTFNFRPIIEFERLENNSIADVIGVVCSVSPTASIMRKNGTETQKRTLQLKDMSDRSIELTLWGNFCNSEGQRLQDICDSGAFPILAVKAARVNEFSGKSVGTINTSQLFVEPEFPEAYRLKEWFEKEGRNVPTISLSKEAASFGRTDARKTISQIKDEKLGTSEKPDWISVCASVSFVKVDNFCYTACPIMIGDRQCNKKVTNNGDGKWRCDRCDQSVDACDYRYILQFQIQDHTGLTWVTAFQECGEEIMGIAAKDLYYLKFEEQDDEKFAEIIRKVLFTKYVFKLKVKEETFSDEQRVKSTAVKADKLNFASESRFLLDLIEKLKVEKAEGTNPNSLMNNVGLGNIGTGQARPAVYNNPTMSTTNGSRDYGMAANQVGQYGNQYNNSSYASAVAPGSYMSSCNNCGGSGHSSAQCPHIANRPGQSVGGAYSNRVPAAAAGSGGVSGECFKCHQTGHWAKDCPGFSAAPAYGTSNVVQQGRYGIPQKQQYGGY